MTQMEIIRDKLSEDGFISRNFCLQNFISRLGSRIYDLKQEGWEFKTKTVDTDRGHDYIYQVTKRPSEQPSMI